MEACPHYDQGEGPTDGLPCQYCEDDKARAWHKDGHKVIAEFDTHECLMISIVCPGHEARECRPEGGTTVHVYGNCLVMEELAQAGGEMFDGRAGTTVALPADIHWRWHLEYGDEPESYIEVEFIGA